jgi:hypothetical protein
VLAVSASAGGLHLVCTEAWELSHLHSVVHCGALQSAVQVFMTAGFFTDTTAGTIAVDFSLAWMEFPRRTDVAPGRKLAKLAPEAPPKSPSGLTAELAPPSPMGRSSRFESGDANGIGGGITKGTEPSPSAEPLFLLSLLSGDFSSDGFMQLDSKDVQN